LTSPDVEKNPHEVDFKATWTINEEYKLKKEIIPDSVCGMGLASTWRVRLTS